MYVRVKDEIIFYIDDNRICDCLRTSRQMDLLDHETVPFCSAVVCAANSPESRATINQRGALGARHLLTEIISAAPRTGPETQSGGHPLACFGCRNTRGG